MTAPAVDGDVKVNYETARFILDFTRHAPEHLISDGDQMDGKAFQLFTVASGVLAIAAFAFEGGGAPLITALLLIATVVYVGAITAVLQVVRKRTYHGGDYATWLWRYCYADELQDVIHALASAVPKACEQNQKVNSIKAEWLARAHGAIAAETLLVAVALIASRL